MAGDRKDGRGRPRSAEVDRAVLAAAADLLAERGYAELTIEAVATRAGVGRPTVYRRWPGKDDLVAAALVHAAPPLTPPDTGDALRDLVELAVGFVVRLARSPLGWAVLGVHAESGRNARLAGPLYEHYLRPRDVTVTGLIERGRREGTLRADLTADVIRDLVFGPLVYHWLVTGELDRATADTLATAARAAVAT